MKNFYVLVLKYAPDISQMDRLIFEEYLDASANHSRVMEAMKESRFICISDDVGTTISVHGNNVSVAILQDTALSFEAMGDMQILQKEHEIKAGEKAKKLLPLHVNAQSANGFNFV